MNYKLEERRSTGEPGTEKTNRVAVLFIAVACRVKKAGWHFGGDCFFRGGGDGEERKSIERRTQKDRLCAVWWHRVGRRWHNIHVSICAHRCRTWMLCTCVESYEMCVVYVYYAYVNRIKSVLIGSMCLFEREARKWNGSIFTGVLLFWSRQLVECVVRCAMCAADRVSCAFVCTIYTSIWSMATAATRVRAYKKSHLDIGGEERQGTFMRWDSLLSVCARNVQNVIFSSSIDYSVVCPSALTCGVYFHAAACCVLLRC